MIKKTELISKHANLQADITRSVLEGEIDHAQRVAARQLHPTGMIYGLIEDEVRIVEG